MQPVFFFPFSLVLFSQLASLYLNQQDPGRFGQTDLRQEFFNAIAEWRSEYGIPVSLIVMGSEEQVQDLCRVPFGCGVRVQIMSPLVDFTTTITTAASSRTGGSGGDDEEEQQSWICRFLRHLILDDGDNYQPSKGRIPPPILLWDTISKSLRDYCQRHRSCTTFVQELKQGITHFYASSRGSFVWDLTIHSPDFVAWFCTYSNASNLFSNHDQCGWEKFVALQKCRQIQEQIQYCWEGIVIGLPMYIEDVQELSLRTAMPILGKLYAWAKKILQERIAKIRTTKGW